MAPSRGAPAKSARNDALVPDNYHLIISPCLAISFQRYPEELLQTFQEVPRSHGALPIERITATLAFLPVRTGEGVWLGLSPRVQRQCPIEVKWFGEAQGGDLPLPWVAEVSSLEFLHGLHKRDGTFCPFLRFPRAPDHLQCLGLDVSAPHNHAIQIRFVDIAEFESRTGKPGPPLISPDDSYGGWLLP